MEGDEVWTSDQSHIGKCVLAVQGPGDTVVVSIDHVGGHFDAEFRLMVPRYDDEVIW